ncbi:hypothetical protein B0H14DRAFT_3464983 [Mycena olivaceomarginata]|nr:hypothetical protein B0H14DRAFT_3464983 [Mycena olivaceomarginata]
MAWHVATAASVSLSDNHEHLQETTPTVWRPSRLPRSTGVVAISQPPRPDSPSSSTYDVRHTSIVMLMSHSSPAPALPTSKAPTAGSNPAPSKIPTYLRTLKSGLELLLRNTEPFLEGTPFQIPVKVINAFIELANVISDNNSDLKTLFEDVSKKVEIMNDSLEKAASAEAKDRVCNFSRLLKQEMEHIEEMRSRGLFVKILESDENTKAIAAVVQKIDGLLKDFQLHITIAIERKVDDLTIQSSLNVLYHAAANDASHTAGERYNEPGCHPETRKDIIADLLTRALRDDPSGSILWVHGPAGAGKSALMQSLCEELAKKGRLAGSFFFKRGHPSRGRAMKLFPTIAYQVAFLSPQLKGALGACIANDPAIVDKQPSKQLQKPVVEPYGATAPTQTLVVVIDGLDECEDPTRRQEILRAIGNALHEFQPRLRFLVASRPEPDIAKAFSELNVHHDPTDIGKSFEDLARPWPSKVDLERLVQKSSGYFIYAKTVIQFIDDKKFRPEKRLRIIMDVKNPDYDKPFAALDQLYTQILDAEDPRPEHFRILSILAARMHFSPKEIEQLLGLEPGDVQLMLRGLHSLIKMPSVSESHSGNRSITVHHASFLDFLNDPARSGKFHYGDFHHQSLASDIIRVFCDIHDTRPINPLDHVAWIIYAYTLLTAPWLFNIRLVLDYSWAELRTAVCSLREIFGEDEAAIQSFIRFISHPSWMRKLHPDPTLWGMAERSLWLANNDIREPGAVCSPPGWGRLLRTCTPSFDILHNLCESMRDGRNIEEAYNIQEWLKTFPDPPPALTAQFQETQRIITEAAEKAWATHHWGHKTPKERWIDWMEEQWTDWKQRTGW